MIAPNHLIYSPNPVLPSKDQKRYKLTDLEVSTLDAVLTQCLGPIDRLDVLVYVNDEIVPRISWTDYKLNGDEFIVVKTALHGGDDSNPLAIIATIVLIAYAGPAAKALGFASDGIAAAVIVVAGTALINAIFPPSIPNLNSGASLEQKPSFSISGGRNQARLEQPFPLIVGRHRFAPDHGAQPFSVQDTENEYFHQVFNFGYGNLTLSDFHIGNTELNPTNYPELVLEESGDDGVLERYPTNVDTLSINAPLTFAASWIQRTTSADTVRLTVDIAGQLFKANDDGTLGTQTVSIDVEYRKAGDTTWLAITDGTYRAADPFYLDLPDWHNDAQASSQPGRLRISNNDNALLRRSYTIEVEEGQYEVRVRRASPEFSSPQQKAELTYAQLKSHQKDNGDYTGQKRIAIRIPASSNANGVLDRFTALVEATIPIWNGSAWVEAASSNPAYIFYYLAKGIKDANGKVIAGVGLPDERIDLDGIIEWADWCDLHGLECNFVFAQTINLDEALSLVARTGRASYTWAKGVLGVVYDQEDQFVTQMFGMGNIVRDSFNVNYITQNLADEIVVKFINEDLDYGEDEVRLEVPGIISPINPTTITLHGVTSVAQAAKEGNLIAARQRYNRRRVSFETDIEGMVCSRGQVIAISHDLTSWAVSGRLRAGTTTALTLSREVTFDNADPHYIGVKAPDNTIEVVEVTNPYVDTPITTTEIDLAEALTFNADADVDNDPVDYQFHFGYKITPGEKFKVVSLQPTSEGRVLIEAQDEKDEYYDAEGTAFDYTPPTLIGELATVENVTVEEQYQGYLKPLKLHIKWELKHANAAQLRVRRNSGEWRSFGTIQGTAFTLDLPEYANGDEIQIELTARALVSLKHAGGITKVTYFVSGLPSAQPNIVVPNVSGLELFNQANLNEYTGKEAKFAWRRVSSTAEEFGSETLGADTGALDDFFEDYEVRVFNSNGTLRRIDHTKDEAYTYTYEKNVEDGNGTPERTIRVAVYIRTKTNQLSPKGATLLVTNPPPVVPTLGSIETILKTLYVTATRSSDIDFSGMEVHASTAATYTPNVDTLIYDGQETIATISDTGFAYGTTYYIRVGYYDAFGKESLNYSAEQAVTPIKLDDADVQVEINTREGLINSDDWIDPPSDTMGEWTRFLGSSTNAALITDEQGPFGEIPPILRISGTDPASAPGWFMAWKHNHDVNPNRGYLTFIWVRRNSSATDHGLYLGYTVTSGGAETLKTSAGTATTNPYFITNAGSELTLDKWYLAVGVIHPTEFEGDTGIAGLYDPDDGAKIIDGSEFSHINNTINSQFFRFGFYSNTTSFGTADGFDFAKPTMFIQDGAEPSIEGLLRIVRNQGLLATLDEIDTTNVATGTALVESFASDPTTGNFEGRVYVNSTDGKLYRYSSGVWTAAVPTADLTGTVDLGTQISGTLTEAFAEAGLINSNVTINADGTLTGAGSGQASLNSLPGAVSLDTQISGTLSTTFAEAGLINNNVTINADGSLTGAGGGQASLTSLPGSVQVGSIAANAVTAGTIAALAVTAGKIDAGAVTATEIAADAITATKIAANAVTAGKIAALAVTAGTIAADAVTATEIAANAITASEIAAGAVTATEIAADAVTANKILAGAVVAGKIAADAVTATTIATNSITAAKINADAVTSAKIAADAVTAAKINVASLSAISADMGSLTAGTIALDSTGWIRSGQTGYATGSGFWLGKDGTTTKLSIGNSAGNQLTWDGTNLSLPGASIANGTITASKLNVTSLSAITADLGTITAGNMTLNTAGFVKGGQTAFHTGTGFFLGYSSGYKFSIGNPTSGNYLTWDGTSLTIKGEVFVGNYVASNVVLMSADTERTTSLTGFVLKKQFISDRGGAVRIKFEVKRDSTGDNLHQWRIKRNSTVINTGSISSTSYVAVSQDVTGLTADDTIGIEIHGSSGDIGERTSFIRNADFAADVVLPADGGSVALD